MIARIMRKQAGVIFCGRIEGHRLIRSWLLVDSIHRDCPGNDSLRTHLRTATGYRSASKDLKLKPLKSRASDVSFDHALWDRRTCASRTHSASPSFTCIFSGWTVNPGTTLTFGTRTTRTLIWGRLCATWFIHLFRALLAPHPSLVPGCDVLEHRHLQRIRRVQSPGGFTSASCSSGRLVVGSPSHLAKRWRCFPRYT